jgi:hypothetical protein
MLKVKTGEIIHPGDMVSIDANGEVAKAHLNDIVVGVIVNDQRLGFVVKTLSQKGYMGIGGGSTILQLTDGLYRSDEVLVDSLLSSAKVDPNLVGALKSRLVKKVSKRREEAKAVETVSGIVQEAVEKELMRDSISESLRKMGLPKGKKNPLGDPFSGSMDFDSTMTDVRINFDKKGKGMVWIGLLCVDGKEVSANEYCRQAVEVDIHGTTADIVFPTAISDWGTITAMGVFNKPDAPNPMIIANVNNGPIPTMIGTTLNLAKITIQTGPVDGSEALAEKLSMNDSEFVEELSVNDSDKEKLKLKIERARAALKGAFK